MESSTVHNNGEIKIVGTPKQNLENRERPRNETCDKSQRPNKGIKRRRSLENYQNIIDFVQCHTNIVKPMPVHVTPTQFFNTLCSNKCQNTYIDLASTALPSYHLTTTYSAFTSTSRGDFTGYSVGDSSTGHSIMDLRTCCTSTGEQPLDLCVGVRLH